MKKIYIRLSAFFIALIVAFLSIPFFNVCAVSSIPSWLSSENIQYFFATQSGLVDSSNNSLQSFFENPNAQTLYDAVNNAVVFVPGMGAFRLGVPDVQLEGYSKDDCDIVVNDDDTVSFSGDFVDSTLSGLGTKISSPLDGVKVITNFSNFNNIDYSVFKHPEYVQNFVSSLKNEFLSSYGNVVVFYNPSPSDNEGSFTFSSVNSNEVYFVLTSVNNYLDCTPRFKYDNSWVTTQSKSSGFFNGRFVNSLYSKDAYYYLGSNNRNYFNVISSPTAYDSSLCNISTSDGYMSRKFSNLYYWSSYPLVIASTDVSGQNYFYWLHSSPSGVYYNTVNFQNSYNTSFLDNNWEQTYNNYITDVSNYYSTTENITNEQLTQYIDNSTTITNITNNYITNNNGGGSVDDDIITNSWLERIYNKLLDIISILRGQSLSDSSDIYITDNSIKNDIIEYPLSEYFPDLPSDYFIPEDSTISIPLFSQKVSRVLSTAMPFCYIEKLKDIASVLSTPPQTPYYEIPFVIDSFGIDEVVTISFEDNAWSVLHSVWIALFMIIFILALFYMTYRFILLVSSIIG